MTVAEAMTDVFEALGEPTDLAFLDENQTADATTRGYTTLRRAMERGMVATLQYKSPRGRRLKWPGSTVRTSVRGGATATVTLSAVTGTTLTTVETVAEDFYLGYVVTSGTELRSVVYSSGNVLEVGEAFTTPPGAGDVLTLRQTFLPLASSQAVLSVTDTTTGTPLELVRPEAVSWETSPTTGDPQRYYHINDRVYVDPPPETPRYFLLEQEQYPTLDDVIPTAELPLPEPLHYAVVLWTTAWGFGRMLNPEMQRFVKRQWQEVLNETQLPEDNIMDRTEDRFGIRRQ